MQQVAVIDYGSGNLRSAHKALAKAAADRGLARDIVITADPDRVAKADRVVLPGVGAFGDCRRGLDAIDGMADALTAVRAKNAPFLGICVGMQLLGDAGMERGQHPGLGWIGGVVEQIAPADAALKVPHMGWNQLKFTGAEAHNALIKDLTDGCHMYFVHSFALTLTDPSDLAASTDYGGPVTAMVLRDSIVGTQFHPEKSQAAGQILLGNFLSWQP